MLTHGHEQHQRHHGADGQFVDFRSEGHAVHAGHFQIEDAEIKGFAAAEQIERLARIFNGARNHSPSGGLFGEHMATGHVVIHNQNPQVGELGLAGIECGRRGVRFGPDIHGKMKRRAFARRAFGPHFAAHEFDQTLADGQAQARAAVALRGRSIRLHERFEQPRQAVGLDADARVAHGKVQVQERAVLAFIHFARKQFYPDEDVAVFGEFDGVAQQIGEHLAEAQRIALDGAGNAVVHLINQVQIFLISAHSQKVE